MALNMKKILLPVILLFASAVFSSSSPVENESQSSSYDIVCIYESVDIPSGSKALDSYGNLTSIQMIYVPTKIDLGKYSVEVTRIESNLYQICGTDLYVETRYCYEYAYREEVVMNVSSNYGYSRGELVFF